MAKKPKKKRTANNTFLINKEQFGKLMDKLDTLIKVTAASVFRGEKLKEGIVFLSDFGFTAKEVAKILGTTEQYVYNVNSEAKKEQKRAIAEKKEEKTQEQKTPNPTE